MPQVSEHVLKSVQSVYVQSSGHGPASQGALFLGGEHALPPWAATVLIMR
jgi:hypothetical protein